MKPRVMVSLCLLGARCRYDGRDNAVEGMEELFERCEIVPVCPEQLGGLSTPRTPSERLDDRVITRDGADVTDAFCRGAEEAVRLANRFGVRYALLKARSPSCGSGMIYDGSFTGCLVPGDGVTAQALRRMGITLYDEGKLDSLLNALRGRTHHG